MTKIVQSNIVIQNTLCGLNSKRVPNRRNGGGFFSPDVTIMVGLAAVEDASLLWLPFTSCNNAADESGLKACFHRFGEEIPSGLATGEACSDMQVERRLCS